MATTAFVNKPGGVIVHLHDGTSESLAYGDPVPSNLADYVDPSRFSDASPRAATVDAALEAEAHRRAAFAEDGQVNSSSSAVPGNYSELDEDGASVLMGNLDKYPEAQAQLLIHELLYAGGRRKVIDSASDYAKKSAESQIGAIPAELKDPQDHTEGAFPSGFGDPDATDPETVIARAIAQQTGKPVEAVRASARGRSTPAPSPEVAKEVGPGGENPGGSGQSPQASTRTDGSTPGEKTEPETEPELNLERANKEQLEREVERQGKTDQVVGTGRDGAITKDDLKKVLGA